jgi:hypothetical protein
MKWHERPVRMMRLDYVDQLKRMKDADLDALARSKAEDWHVNCEWVIGTPGIAPGLGYLTTFNTDKFEKYADLGDWDLIREYLPHARKYGIKVLAYLNMHWFSYDFAAQHPGWEQLLADGTPYGQVSPLYGGGTTFCVNSGWRDWAMDMIAETMKTGIDGVFLDGPVVFPGACYCPTCRETFKARYGADIPETEDWSDERWKDFIEFREDSMSEFLRDCRASVQAVNPEGVIFLNGGSWHAGAWRVARDIEKVGDFEDFNGAEAFFHPGPRAHVLHFWATAAKHLVAGGKPSVVFSHHALGSWHYIPLPPIECQLAIAQTAACGSNPWFAVFDYALDHSRDLAVEGVKGIQSFLDEHDEYYTGAKSCADIALLYSRQAATYWMSEQYDIFGDRGSGQERDLIADMGTGKKIVDWKKRKQIADEISGNSYLGWFTALTREHIPFDVLLDKDLNADGISRYKTLIMPNAACLSDEQAQAVKQFVEQGGGLVAEFETGEYDERGRKRPSNPLADVLGIVGVEGAMPPAHGEEYVKVKAAHPTTGAFNMDQLIARMPYSLKVTRHDAAQAPIVFMEQIGRLYSAVKGETGFPALVANYHGGGRVVYFPGLAGEFYGRYRMMEYQKLLSDAVRWVHEEPLILDAECPPTVEIELWQQDDPRRTLVHLVNNTGDMQRPITEIIPIREVKVRLRLPYEAKRVHTLGTCQDLSFTRSGEDIEFSVYDLGLYEVVVVE